MMTAHGSVESVKEALRGGAFDYLEKPIDRDQLLKVVQDALGRLNRIDDEIIGQSEEMERVKKMILKVAGFFLDRNDSRRLGCREGARRSGDSQSQPEGRRGVSGRQLRGNQ